MARTVMSTVVLKDVVVVLGFTIAAVIAAQYLGIAENDGHLLADLLWHIGGSLLFGAGVGGLLALYLRFVNKEVLLVLVGVVYTASFVASELHLDTVLLFLAAGFAVANFSRHGHALIESVERLSMPVFVVFFTLAGAKLHLDEVVHLFFFAAALVLVRGVSIFLGARFGARLAGADEGTRRYGWLGFLSQAGVAITLSTQISEKLGEPGKAIGTLLIAGVAINEMIGPVLLKVGLSLAGEVRGDPEEAELEHDAIEPEPEPEPRTAEIEPWPEAELGRDPWGSPPESGSTEIDGRLVDLQIDLQRLVRDLQRGPIERFRGQAEAYVRELRREFLRHHRRLTVQARIEGQGESLASMLRSEQAELADRWRGAVLGRSARLASRAWSPEEIVEALDYLVDTLPQRVEAAHTETSFVDKPKQSTWMALSRSALRWNRTLRRRFGKELRPRAFDLRAVARYHLGGQIPARLEGLAAILVQADRHLAARTRSLLDGIVMGYDSLAIDVCGEGCDAHARLVRQREQIEEELGLALEEIERMARDATRRTARILGRGFQALKEDVRIAGTIDLPERARRTTKVFKARSRALELFGASLRKHQEISAAGYSLLAMELELVGLEARVKDSLEEHVSRIESAVRGRTFVHAERVHAALEAALEEVERELSTGQQGDALAAALRRATELPERAAAEGARAAIELRDTLYDESRLRPLIQALSQAAVALTSSYEVVVGRVERGEWTLPSFPARVEVPFRETVITYVDTEVAPELLVRTRALAERLEPYVQALQELGRTIAFNVELATAELEVVHDEEVPRETLKLLSEMIAGQLERSETLAASFVEQSARWPDDCGEALRDSVLGALDELRGALVDGDVSRARLAAMRRADARRRLLREAWQLPRVLRELREQMAHAITVTIGEQRLETWRKVLGLPASRGQHLIDASLFAAPESRAELPPVYRRLFAAETLEAGDVLLGRDDEIACAEAALGSREVGRLRAVALVGLDGVGKAAVSNAIVRSRGWRNVARISFDAPVSLEEIDALFAERSEGRLVVIDGLHWMIAMRPGGFAPLRRFVDGIVADGGRNAWLVHADLLFWRYASSVAALSDAFPEQVHLHPLTVDELEAAVMARHRLSGYGHLFERAERSSQIEGFVERSASRIRR
ncbi:MAG: cation:proton antiporter, partial [Myxococcales bacterium]|nr:cation:proton antiporter [Myxococcales bacterium]